MKKHVIVIKEDVEIAPRVFLSKGDTLVETSKGRWTIFEADDEADEDDEADDEDEVTESEDDVEDEDDDDDDEEDTKDEKKKESRKFRSMKRR